MTRYPYIDDWRAIKRGSEDVPECDGCDKSAVGYLLVRHGPLRGTDIDAHPVCDRHLVIANDSLDKFFGHVRSKERFLGRPSLSSEGAGSAQQTDD